MSDMLTRAFQKLVQAHFKYGTYIEMHHDDIACIKAALQSDEDGISGDESDVGSDDDGQVASEDGDPMAGWSLPLNLHFSVVKRNVNISNF